MNWLNLRIATLHRPEYIGAEPISRATWLNVLAYCSEQENGGRITGARKWKDRQWQQTCGVCLSEVDAASPLLQWDGEDLTVWEYPLEKEGEVREKRDVARVNGKKGGRPKTDNKPTSEPTLVSENNQRPKAEGEGEGERKENKKKKGNREECTHFCASLGLPSSDGDWFFDKCEGNGWTNDGKPIKDWKATIRAWKAINIMASQKTGKHTEPDLPDRTDELGPCDTEAIFAKLAERFKK